MKQLKENFQHKRFFYITNSRVPTQRAHGLQIAKMCEGFSSYLPEVTLLIPGGFNSITNDIFSYYNLKKNFKIKKLPVIDFGYIFNPIPKIFYWLKSFSFAFSTFFFVLFYTKKNDLIYFRYDTLLFIVLFPFLKKRNITCEAHFLISGWHRSMLLRAENIVVVTKYAKEHYDADIDFEEKVLVAPDGVSLSDFDTQLSQAEIREKLGLPKNKKLVIYTGYFYEWKGVDTLILAAKKFSNDEELVLVGGAGNDIARVKLLIEKEGIKNVTLQGHQPYKKIPLYQKAADCLVITSSLKNDKSKFFTSPLKLFEYMASERPIVASDTPSVREILNEDNAFLVLPDDSDSMLAGIRKALSEHGLIKARRAKNEVSQYEWNMRAKKILEFIFSRLNAPKVLYLFAGERREFIEKFKKGEVSDSQLIGFNFLNKYGIRPYFIENRIMNTMRKINFHLAPWSIITDLFRYDIVFMSSNLFFVFFIKRILNLKNPKIVFYNTFLTNTLSRNKRGLKRYIIEMAIRSMDMIICPSLAQKEFLIKSGFEEKNIVFIHNGVDSLFFKPCESKYDIEQKFVLAIGKDMGRDYHTLFQVACELNDEVIIICSKRNIKEKEVIPKNVKLLFDVSQQKMYEYICNAKYLVLPTYHEEEHFDASDCSGQYVLLEAMAMRKAVVVSERSTLRGYIEHDKNGIIVRAEDPHALELIMKDLGYDNERLERIGKSARELIDHTCNTKRLAESLSIIFKQLTNEKLEN